VNGRDEAVARRTHDDRTVHGARGSVLRPAERTDATALAALCATLGYPGTAERVEDRLLRLREEEDHEVWVATGAGGEVVGWIHAFETHRVESDRFVELGGLVVAESHRGRGIGRALLRIAEEWALGRGITKLRVRTRIERADARSFYVRSGCVRTKRQDVYDKDVDPRAETDAKEPPGGLLP